MLRFDLVGIRFITRAEAESEPEPVFVTEPYTEAQRLLAARRASQAAFLAVRKLPGFGGYSLRPGKYIVLDGKHISVDELPAVPRIFPSRTVRPAESD